MDEHAESDIYSDVEGPVDLELYDLAAVIESAGIVLDETIEQFLMALESGHRDEEASHAALHALTSLEEGLSDTISRILDFENEP